MQLRAMLVAALVFSGFSALVYQVLWTRLLGFAFGTTTEAIGVVLAIFFGGLALGGALAARSLRRISRPLRLYAWLELGIGGFALLTLPLLRKLDVVYVLLDSDASDLQIAIVRVVASALILLPPTIAMGATLPVVVRGVVLEDATLGRWSAFLYTANTLGAVLGAYLCGFWLIATFGITWTILCAAVINVGIAALVLILTRRHDPSSPPPLAAVQSVEPSARIAESDPSRHTERVWFLAFFALSGFVAIGYEIVWSKIFTIVMEGTLYSFATVLSSFLLGIALGSLAIARFVDRIDDLPRAFGLLHVAIPVSVALGVVAVGDLPYWHKQLGATGGVHAMFLIAAPIVLLPTLLFGAAFPLLIRIYTDRASDAGEGIGVATALNTGGSIVASLGISFWAIPTLGSDAVLFALLLLQLGMAIVVLLRGAEQELRSWVPGGIAILALAVVSLGFGGAHLERAVHGRDIRAETLADYRRENARLQAQTEVAIEGKTSLVTVHRTQSGWKLFTNGMPESSVYYGPPYRTLEGFLLGVMPYMLSSHPERSLIVGFGGGGTVDALLTTETAKLDVVELEPSVIEAATHLYQGRALPMADPRLELRINDGRFDLLTARLEDRERYGVIASQPSHPWLVGAANLFTEEYFELVRRNLAPGGVFALWLNGFHNDDEAFLSIASSFERVFPGGTLLTGSQQSPRLSMILLGSTEPLSWNLERLRARFDERALNAGFALHGIHSVEELLARIEGPIAAFAALEPESSNTDDNAFVELRLARNRGQIAVDFDRIESRLPESAPVLTQVHGELDLRAVAEAMLNVGDTQRPRRAYAAKAARLIRTQGAGLPDAVRQTLEAEAELWTGADPERALARLRELSERFPSSALADRALGNYLARGPQQFAAAAQHFARAWERSRDPADAFSAARATYPTDPEAVPSWIERIPTAERVRFPRLAFYQAESALRKGASEAELREHYDALIAYRETPDGRQYPGVENALGRLALSLGLERAARGFLDADAAKRKQRAAPLLAATRRALAANRPEEAARTLVQARMLVPGSAEGIELAARLAAIRKDETALNTAFEELRAWAPALDAAIALENQLRLRLQLELLPQEPSEQLVAQSED